VTERQAPSADTDSERGAAEGSRAAPADAFGMGAVPTAGRLLAIDYGARRWGFAVSNHEQTIASPLETYACRNPQLDAQKLAQLVAEFGPAGIVVGLPVHLAGHEGQKARECRAFAAWVAEQTRLPIAFADERLTTVAAEQFLQSMELSKKKRQARVDKLAAAFLLQAFLDSNQRARPPEPYRS